jgi:class 3 adenylate cyclase/tetratricopeptide (TPR) repeat protein
MVCLRCQHTNREGARFCEACGSPLASLCPVCGNQPRPGATFCDQCGAPLRDQPATASPESLRAGSQMAQPSISKPPAEKILTTRGVLAGERKQVTVLFADLKGSLELLADRDPEEARQILDPVLERMMEAVHRYEGTVNQVMGDGIMALFGAPLAHEDHALRACYAALAIQDAIQRYAEQARHTHGIEVQIRVGLNSGEAVVRAIGSDLHLDYTAVGQTTHLAARMEQLARPGAILLTAETWRLVEGYFDVKPLGAVPVKGLTTPVQTYELIRAEAARSRLQIAAARGLTPFVGRGAELAALHQMLERAAEGHGQVVALVGEPGAGRSRLIYELTQTLSPSDWLIIESRAASYGQGMPYLPVLELLKTYFQLADRDDPRQVRVQLTAKLLAMDATLRPTLSPLLALLDVAPEDPQWPPLDAAQRRQQTLDAVKRLLLRESQIQPILLVVEDLHWIDAGTQAILDTLVESLPAARLLLLVSYRPEYEHSWSGKTYYTQLRVDPLPPKDSATLLQALLGDNLSLAALKQRLIERTEGNPLFLEESVRTLVETQVLVGERGGYRLVQARRRSSVHESPELVGERAAYHLMKATESIRVPATVQAVLAARIDRLPSEEKSLLQTAAVIGAEVPFSLLQAITGRPEETLRLSLGHLQAAELLYESRLFPELIYLFKHALTHEVAYGSLLQGHRRTLHRHIIDTLERVYADRLAEQIERLAHHTQRGEVWEKAVSYCRQAGARAEARGAFREAVTYFEQALEALGHLPATVDTNELAIELRLDLAEVLIPLGAHGRSRALLGTAETLARQLGDRVRLARVLAKLAIAHRMEGDLGDAMAAGQQALAMAAELGDDALRISAAHRLGQVYYGRGEFRRAAELLRQTVAALTPDMPAPEPYYRITSRAWLALTLGAMGAFAEGRRHGEEALCFALTDHQSDATIVAHGCLGLLSLEQGHMEGAMQVLAQGLSLCRASGHRDWSISIAAGLGYAYALTGQGEEGITLLEEAIREELHTGTQFSQAILLTRLSAVEQLVGRSHEARRHVHQGYDLARQQQARGDEALALYQLGTLHAHAGSRDLEQAEESYREALTLAHDHGMRPLQAHCHLGLGTVYATIGRRDRARTELSTAIELYNTMDMPFWLPQAETALSQAEGRR